MRRAIPRGLTSRAIRKQILLMDDIEIDVHFKRVKYLRVVVKPHDGSVRVSAPYFLDIGEVNRFLTSRRQWITETRERYRNRGTLNAICIEPGGSIPFLGGKLPLCIIETEGRQSAVLISGALTLHVKYGAAEEDKGKLLEKWYRKELKAIADRLLPGWEQTIGIKVSELRIKKMKTRWGTCNAGAGRIWLNLELIRFPVDVIETIMVHEMIHFLERGHNKRFYSLMTQCLPDWKIHSQKLYE